MGGTISQWETVCSCPTFQGNDFWGKMTDRDRGITWKGLRGQGMAIQWAVLVVSSALFVLLLEALRLPASLLLGPMSAAILIAAADGSVRVPRWPFFAAQAVIGCMIARSTTPSTIGAISHNWPLFLATSLGVIGAANALGWLLARCRILPGTTAIWGSSPGAATAMVLMADAQGADVRLVAFMQYLRVVIVAVAASVISRLWTAASNNRAEGTQWFSQIHWWQFGETLTVIVVGLAAAFLWRVPAGPFLLPLAIGAVLNGSGLLTIELPPWLLALSYAVAGWSIGLRFTPSILSHAARALPGVLAAILALTAISGGLAFLLVWLSGIDPLTAYLATSPGGADSVAIIAASTNVDVPFVMAQQTARFLIVLFIGPAIASLAARWTGVAARP
jgi:uncharacterized protein